MKFSSPAAGRASVGPKTDATIVLDSPRFREIEAGARVESHLDVSWVPYVAPSTELNVVGVDVMLTTAEPVVPEGKLLNNITSTSNNPNRFPDSKSSAEKNSLRRIVLK